jgi:FlaA1/EpsC-like NDP-sugar epimerase
VKIVDLARNMVRLSGREPDADIAVEIIGRRPGEKLHEELFNADEKPLPTEAEKILAAGRPPVDPLWVEEAFARVESVAYGGDAAALPEAVSTLAREREELGGALAERDGRAVLDGLGAEGPAATTASTEEGLRRS